MRHLYNGALQLNRSLERRKLTSISHADVVHDVLADFAAREATVYVWLIMPDHLHVLYSTTRPHQDLDVFLGRIKRRINEGLARRGRTSLHWRDGAVEHPVTWETLASAREYILQNPVRGQYVTRPEDWPHKATPAPLPGL